MDISGEGAQADRMMRFCCFFWAWMRLTGFQVILEDEVPVCLSRPDSSPSGVFGKREEKKKKKKGISAERVEKSCVYDYITNKLVCNRQCPAGERSEPDSL